MNKFLTLTKVLLKNGTGMNASSSKMKRNLGLLILAVSLIPFVAGTTSVIYMSYGVLEKYRLTGAALSGIEAFTCVAMVIFGVLYVISIYYFTDDTVVLLTLPLKPEAIIASKFVIACLFQYIMEALILLPCIIAFLLRIRSVMFALYAVITLFLLPVIPTVVCSLICILLMAFGRFFRNKDRVKVIAGLLSIALAIGINLVIQTFAGKMTAADLASGKELSEKASMIFPSVRLSAEALLGSGSVTGFLYLLGFLAVTAVSVAILLLFGKGLYLKGVVGLSQSAGKSVRISEKQFEKLKIRRSALFTLAMKDWKILLRTPAYFINCVLGGLIFPPLMFLILGFTSMGEKVPPNGYALSIGAIGLTFICILNLCSPTAVSREGRDFYVSRYIPVPYGVQVAAKLVPGMLMSWGSATLVALLAAFLIRISAPVLLGIWVCSLLMIGGANCLGLLFDIISPKLEWDDETAAVKRNFNFFVEFILLIVLFALLLLLVYVFQMNFPAAFAVTFIISAAVFAVSYRLLFSKGVQIFSGYNSGFYKKYVKKAGQPDLYGWWRLKGGKTIAAVFTILMVVLVGAFTVEEMTADVKVSIDASKVNVKAGFTESCTFNTADIETVELKNSIPSISKISGLNAGNKNYGYFNVSGMGKGNVYINSKQAPFLYVVYKSGFLILQYSNPAKTKSCYDKLVKYVPSGS